MKTFEYVGDESKASRAHSIIDEFMVDEIFAGLTPIKT
jgi:hypothetical protein